MVWLVWLVACGAPAAEPSQAGCAAVRSDRRYADLAPLRGPALRAALHERVSDGAVGHGYDAARNRMYGITGSIDVHDGWVTCVYTGAVVRADGSRSPGPITTEHSWPRSDGARDFPAEGDMHHLFPAVAEANGTRGSFTFGDVACGHAGERDCPWSEGGSHLGPAVDGRGTVFEVRPSHRGDIARAHFYFAVRYGASIPAAEEATLRRWSAQDPPSAEERARNDAIAQAQGNRNPFVDAPGLVECVGDL